ncbi:citramalate synthase [Arsenicicoccus sp. oral taxon 190]|uniref:citramalate synthase n=1 Tax=Arsenicicoccus sp. oral taxon 190 TaxID=1658671 RepID=UPI00067A3525|nr:citramalate synthase [Arsenicicoccus sp. oral taxon 190]AKT52292.1 transferase [Arsenicicoccus sp. oral taxon 190]
MGDRPALQVYDTTLRDGAQQEGLHLTVQDKIAIARHLDELGVGFIEGGWPGANPRDTEFFAGARDLRLQHAVLTAFGATRKAGGQAHSDAQVRALLDSGAPAITLVAKAHTRHVEQALRTTLAENLAMIRDTVTFLVGEGRRVFLDAEHFFDGYQLDRDYALEAVRAAVESGAEVVALCDTNGGMLPSRIADVVDDVTRSTGAPLGIHCHNDTGCAVANSLAAVDAGVVQVQGTVNGYGERTGNADLLTIISNLQLKLDRPVVADAQLAEASRISHSISEITNITPYGRQPYVGSSAFAHKAGLHASALKVDPDLYQHTDPSSVGNRMRTLVSDMAGRASIELRARELGLDLSGQGEVQARIVALVKDLELRGWTFDAADASFELLLRREVTGEPISYCEVESWRVIAEARGDGVAVSEATVKLRAGGRRLVATGEGNGPVNALDEGLRNALVGVYPEIDGVELVDYKVRILDSAHGSDAITRVLIEMADDNQSWTTVGVAANIVEASWMALLDGLTYGLHSAGVPVR